MFGDFDGKLVDMPNIRDIAQGSESRGSGPSICAIPSVFAPAALELPESCLKCLPTFLKPIASAFVGLHTSGVFSDIALLCSGKSTSAWACREAWRFLPKLWSSTLSGTINDSDIGSQGSAESDRGRTTQSGSDTHLWW
jgi:hypothetical protein